MPVAGQPQRYRFADSPCGPGDMRDAHRFSSFSTSRALIGPVRA
ncbi:hypothetical protein GPOL_174p00500 (plasmid) [Gordonia polyisoprenivorans VH2]|uniref:Uncharacterized protein n=1 Tax=Gordonia polyisoprenivorans (strain DSM 44266 / VH2) TaxID=1112204 RepID=H6N524_GORPV|nr:hypothetical protein GPOL_174p00500 [Gordonia polyisoprenivorans VH2]